MLEPLVRIGAGTPPGGEEEVQTMGRYPSVDRGGRATGALLLALATLGVMAASASAAATTITSFTPTSGRVGTRVVITGTGFTGATAVRFGGVDTTSMTVDSATQITAFVPPFAVTGPIAVSAPGGTATSSTHFAVIPWVHRRAVSLHLPGDEAKGVVTVKDKVDVCRARVPVNIQHLVNGSWRYVASLTTSVSGAFRVGGVIARGKYRAVAKKVTLGGTDICKRAVSPTVGQEGGLLKLGDGRRPLLA